MTKKAMSIACIGGGPGGLFFATLFKSRNPQANVTVFERNRAEDTFGFGVVFSDATLASIHAADPVLRKAMDSDAVHWDDIEVRLKGERLRCGGNGMTAIVRKTLLRLLQERARQVDVDMRYETEVNLADLADFDLVVACDGANSRTRDQLAEHFEPTFDTASAKFIWFGTTYQFSGLTFVHVKGEHGVFAVHGYPIGDDLSTFIVETDEETWRRAGLDEFDVTQPPGASDLKTKAYLEALFAEQIDGHRLVVNNSRWANFRTRRAGRWSHGRVALLGDSAHTAHFSVGSGTKMAMEDAISLADAIDRHGEDLDVALASYEEAARPAVEKIQDSARPSLSWWEHFGRYHDTMEPWQFAFHFISRSIDIDKVARRDPAFVAAVRGRWHDVHGAEVLHTPFDFAGIKLTGRCVDVAVGDPIWGQWIQAPDTEAGMPDARDLVRQRAQVPDATVAIHGGSELTRVLLSEEARLGFGLSTLVVPETYSEARAETLVLSGRADIVGRPR